MKHEMQVRHEKQKTPVADIITITEYCSSLPTVPRPEYMSKNYLRVKSVEIDKFGRGVNLRLLDGLGLTQHGGGEDLRAPFSADHIRSPKEDRDSFFDRNPVLPIMPSRSWNIERGIVTKFLDTIILRVIYLT